MVASATLYTVGALGAPLYLAARRGPQVGSLFPGARVPGELCVGERIHDNDRWVCMGIFYAWSERLKAA